MASTRLTMAAAAALVTVVAACGGDSDATPTTPAPTSAPVTTAASPPQATTSPPPAATTTEPGPLRIVVAFFDGESDITERITVERGDEIEIVVTADVSDEVHAHGYDFKAEVTPDQPAVITFVADLPGIYEVELEDAHILLFELEVR